MRGTEAWALAVLPTSGQEAPQPPGSFLAGEMQQGSVWGISERVGWLPTRPGMAALAWPEFMDIVPWLPRDVPFPVQFSKWLMLSSSKPMRSWRWGCYVLHPVHFHGLGGLPLIPDNTADILRFPWLGLSGVSPSQSSSCWASSILSKAVQVLLPQHCFPKWPVLQNLSPIRACVSLQSGGQWSAPCPPLFNETRFFSLFSFFLSG